MKVWTISIFERLDVGFSLTGLPLTSISWRIVFTFGLVTNRRDDGSESRTGVPGMMPCSVFKTLSAIGVMFQVPSKTSPLFCVRSERGAERHDAQAS